MLQITIGKLKLCGGGYRPGEPYSRYEIKPGGLRGWWGSAPISGSGTAREGADGEHDEDEFSGPRIITILGRVRAEERARAQMVSELAGLAGRKKIVVRDENGERWAWVRVRHVDIERLSSGHHPDFTIALKAPDPIKYGSAHTSRSTGSDVATVNDGNARAWPLFRVRGPFPGGYRLRGPGGVSYSVMRAMASADVDEIDFKSGLIKRNGVPLTRAVVSPERWSVPGGGRVLWRVEGISGGTGYADLFLDAAYRG